MFLYEIYQNEEVKTRLLRTLGYLLLYFVGLNVLLPFVPPAVVNYPGIESDFGSSLVHNTSVLALGINAYYMASVFVYLITPLFFRDRVGQAHAIRRLVKIVTLVLVSRHAFSYSQIVAEYFLGGAHSAYPFAIGLSWITLVTGALLCMWIADRISDQGLFDGRILLVAAGLFATFSDALLYEVSVNLESGTLVALGLRMCVLCIIVAGIVALTQAIRYVPVKVEEGKTTTLKNPNLRMRFNMIDEYSIYLATHAMGLPLLILQSDALLGQETFLTRYLAILIDPSAPLTLVLTLGLTMTITYYLVRYLIKPAGYLKFLQQWHLTLADIPPEVSAETALRTHINRLAFLWAIALGVVAILPGLVLWVFDMNITFASYFGGYSLFLMVMVFTDFFSKLEQMATGGQTIVARATDLNLNLVYELEEEWDEEE